MLFPLAPLPKSPTLHGDAKSNLPPHVLSVGSGQAGWHLWVFFKTGEARLGGDTCQPGTLEVEAGETGV